MVGCFVDSGVVSVGLVSGFVDMGFLGLDGWFVLVSLQLGMPSSFGGWSQWSDSW